MQKDTETTIKATFGNLEFDELESTCECCEGSGKEWRGNANADCACCGGVGLVLTSLGKSLLSFMQRHSSGRST